MSLTLVVFGVGIVRSFFTPERTRSILAGKRESVAESGVTVDVEKVTDTMKIAGYGVFATPAVIVR